MVTIWSLYGHYMPHYKPHYKLAVARAHHTHTREPAGELASKKRETAQACSTCHTRSTGGSAAAAMPRPSACTSFSPKRTRSDCCSSPSLPKKEGAGWRPRLDSTAAATRSRSAYSEEAVTRTSGFRSETMASLGHLQAQERGREKAAALKAAAERAAAERAAENKAAAEQAAALKVAAERASGGGQGGGREGSGREGGGRASGGGQGGGGQGGGREGGRRAGGAHKRSTGTHALQIRQRISVRTGRGGTHRKAGGTHRAVVRTAISSATATRIGRRLCGQAKPERDGRRTRGTCRDLVEIV